MAKVMQQLDDKILRKLRRLAEKRGISVQELLRAVVIPVYLDYEDAKHKAQKPEPIQIPPSDSTLRVDP